MWDVSNMLEAPELISVIIPIYNIEPYLRRCIDSVLCQTYTNLEILLVDDGSTDGSGGLCDSYVEADNRVRVIHKANGGLAEARNSGLDEINGKYVLFIDGDDYVAPEHIELLYQGLKMYGADISCCGLVRSSDNKIVWPECHNIYQICEPMDAIYKMLYVKGIYMSADGKLYCRDLFDGIRYPAGQLYEDLATTYRIMAKASRIAWTEDQTYCYFQRQGSIVRSKITEKHLVAFEFLQEMEKSFPIDHELHKAVESHYINLCMDFLRNKQSDPDIDRRIWEYVKTYRVEALLNGKAPLRVRLFGLLSFGGRRLTKKILRLYYQTR